MCRAQVHLELSAKARTQATLIGSQEPVTYVSRKKGLLVWAGGPEQHPGKSRHEMEMSSEHTWWKCVVQPHSVILASRSPQQGLLPVISHLAPAKYPT